MGLIIANNIAGVNTVAGDSDEINTLASMTSEINTVAANNANITTVANNIADVNAVAAIDGDVATVAASDASVSTVASNIADVQSAAANMSDIQAAPQAASDAEAARDFAYAWSSAAEDAPVNDGIRSGFSAFHWAAKAAAIVTGNIAAVIHGADAKPSPADADELALVDSADGWSLKKLTWANIKAALSSVFLPKSGGTMTGGLSFGSEYAPAVQNNSRHIALYGTSHGFNVTADYLNYNSSNRHRWLVGGVPKVFIDDTRLTMLSGVALRLSGDPTHDLDATSKQYVDDGLATKADTSSLGNAASLDVGTTAGTVAAGDDSRITGAVQKSSDTALTAGYTTTAVDDGTKSSGTYTPSPAGGNIRKIVNGGAFTLAAPSASGDYTMIIQVTNNSSAGAITLSGFTKSGGDSFTTTN